MIFRSLADGLFFLFASLMHSKAVKSDKWLVARTVMRNNEPHRGTRLTPLVTRHSLLATVPIAVLVLLACTSTCLHAQSANARITGLITDPSKAVIHGAQVVAINNDTGVRYPTTTNTSGIYSLDGLPVGPYRIEVENQGFKSIVMPGVILHVQDVAEINFEMAVGSTAESVTVVANAINIDKTDGTVSTVIDHTEIENMPLNGNSLATLFELTPGVVTNAGGSPSNGGGISVNGERPTGNSLSVDGSGENIYIPPTYGRPNVMGAGVATSASGGTNGLLPVDAVEEFRMQTSSYSAEYGRTPGGQIEVKTRGGTNTFNGSLFESFRNQVMDSQDWFISYNNALYGSSVKQPPLRMNDFGGTFGGPLVRNRIFFFVAHESLYMNQPQPSISVDVPDQNTRTDAATVFQPYLSLYPIGNGGEDPNNPGSDVYNFSFSNMIRDHSTSVRMDANLPKDMHAFFRVNLAPSYLEIPYIFAGTINNVNIATLTGGLFAKFSPRVVNEITVNYSSNDGSYGSSNVPKPFSVAAGNLVNLANTSLVFSPNTWATLGAGPPQKSELHQFNLIDSLTWSVGHHTVKAGIDYRHYGPSLNQASLLQLFTNFSSTSIQDGIVDYVLYAQYENTPRVSANNTSLYVSDDWKTLRDLDLTLGLRWEFNPPPSANNPGLLAMQGNPNDPTTITLAPPGTTLYRTRYDNFAPRFGFAYAVRRSPRFGTTIRGGGGVFFDTGQAAAAAQAAALAYPYFFQSPYLVGVPYSSINVGQIQTANGGLPQGQLYLASPTLVAPRVYEWSLSLDQKVGSSAVVSVSYVGNHGSQLLKESVFYGLSPSIASTLDISSNGQNSSYNALQSQLRIVATKRLNVLASYTYAHAIDDGSNDFTGIAGLAKDERASSDNDVRHVFSSAIHFSPGGLTNTKLLKAITGGWSFDPIVLIQTATPLSVFAVNSQDPNLVNYYADLNEGVPAITSDSTAPGGKRLNALAFAVPPSTRDGDGSRNAYRLFGLTQFDLGAARSWPLWERVNMTFRVDAFNVANHPNFANINTFFDPGALRTFGEAASTYAGSVGSTNAQSGSLNQVFSNGGPRSIQLSLKIRF